MGVGGGCQEGGAEPPVIFKFGNFLLSFQQQEALLILRG